LCDQDKDGYVNINEYCTAKWIALRAMKNVPIPDKIPSNLHPYISNGKGTHNSPKFVDKQKENFEKIQAEQKKTQDMLIEKNAEMEKVD